MLDAPLPRGSNVYAQQVHFSNHAPFETRGSRAGRGSREVEQIIGPGEGGVGGNSPNIVPMLIVAVPLSICFRVR